jgi:hypothetical protein
VTPPRERARPAGDGFPLPTDRDVGRASTAPAPVSTRERGGRMIVPKCAAGARRAPSVFKSERDNRPAGVAGCRAYAIVMKARAVMIRCPTTAKNVPTGIAMDEQSFKTASMSGNSLQCPACGEMHTWAQGKALLQGSEGTPPDW